MIQVNLAEGLFFFFLIHFLNFQVMLESVKEEKFPLLFKVLLASLRIKLARCRLVGENQTQFNAYMRDSEGLSNSPKWLKTLP